MIQNVNLIAVALASVASVGVGFAWYSPIMFGNQWLKLSGLKPKKEDMSKAYGLSMVGAVVMTFVLAQVFAWVIPANLIESLILTFWLWLGFVAPVQATEVLFAGKSWELYLINTGYQLASMLAMAVVIHLISNI